MILKIKSELNWVSLKTEHFFVPFKNILYYSKKEYSDKDPTYYIILTNGTTIQVSKEEYLKVEDYFQNTYKG